MKQILLSFFCVLTVSAYAQDENAFAIRRLLFARHDAAFRSSLGISSLRELFIHAGAHDPDRISEEVLFPLVDSVAVRRDRRRQP